MQTYVTFLAFRLSTNVLLMLLTVGYLHYVHETCSESWLIVNVRLHNNCLLGHVIEFNSSEAWLLEISVIAIAESNGTQCLCMKHS